MFILSKQDILTNSRLAKACEVLWIFGLHCKYNVDKMDSHLKVRDLFVNELILKEA